MTWDELHGILQASGVIRTDAASSTRAPASAGLPDPNPTITGVAYDSRTVERGAVFVALKGLHADGTAFVQQALDRGAAAIIAEEPPSPGAGFGAPGPPSHGAPLPWAVVKDARLALAFIAAAFFRHPSNEMQVVGITGTNGKTTTAYLLSSIFEAAGIRCGVLGTVAYKIGDELREATHTTPEAPDVQRLLREMVDRG